MKNGPTKENDERIWARGPGRASQPTKLRKSWQDDVSKVIL